MAEMLDEFDQPSPMPVSYCQRVSKRKYEQQTTAATEAALNNLLSYLEYNPTAYYEVLRKRKLEQEEEKGWMSFVKVKLFNAVYGDEWSVVDEQERSHKIDQVKTQMIQAFDYSQDAKGSKRRFSKRLAAKRLYQNCNTGSSRVDLKGRPQSGILNIPLKDSPLASTYEYKMDPPLTLLPEDNVSDISDDETTERPLMIPPAPPLPNDENLPNGGKIANGEMRTPTYKTEIIPAGSLLSQIQNKRKCLHQLEENDCSRETVGDFLDEIADPSVRKRLKPVNARNSNERKKPLKNRTYNGHLHFNNQLLDKFRNARSPIETSPCLSCPGSNFTP